MKAVCVGMACILALGANNAKADNLPDACALLEAVGLAEMAGDELAFDLVSSINRPPVQMSQCVTLKPDDTLHVGLLVRDQSGASVPSSTVQRERHIVEMFESIGNEVPYETPQIGEAAVWVDWMGLTVWARDGQTMMVLSAPDGAENPLEVLEVVVSRVLDEIER